mgnify:CR=1 FL=1
MRVQRPTFIAISAIAAVIVANGLNVGLSSSQFSTNYPAVVCPPTPANLTTAISLPSNKTQLRLAGTKSLSFIPSQTLRYLQAKAPAIVESQGSTPIVWQIRKDVWAGATICSSLQNEQWFVGGAADVTTRGRLIIVNSGLSDAVVDVVTFTENGKQPVRATNVSSKNYIVIPIDSLAPGDKTLTVHVVPRSGRINAFMIDEQGKGLKALGGDLVNPAVTASKNVVIPAIPNQISKNTAALPHTLRVLAPGDLDASITVEVVSADGVFVPVGLNSRTISAGVVSEFKLDPNITSNLMAVRISSTEPIVAAVKSTATVSGKKDFVWSTVAPELVPLTMAITGLDPLITFTGENIDVSLKVTLVNGKEVQQNVNGTDITNWRVPNNARSFTIIKVGTGTFAGALVSSANGYGYFPIAAGSLLTKIEVPDSNIRVLNP